MKKLTDDAGNREGGKEVKQVGNRWSRGLQVEAPEPRVDLLLIVALWLKKNKRIVIKNKIGLVSTNSVFFRYTIFVHFWHIVL